MKGKLSKESYKGVRDFYPEDMKILKWMFESSRQTVEKYGYVEYGASLLEPEELYTSKTSEEIVNNQTYTFTDRGGRRVTLRPEMTPTIARMVSANRRELGFPLRWYSIPNLFRYEQPQKGRLREHFQLNVDIFGVSEVEADIEIIQIAYEIMRKFGAKESEFEIRINDRQSKLKGIAESTLSVEQKREIIKLLDKKEKISGSDFKSKVKEILGKVVDLEFEESEKTKEVIGRLKRKGIGNTIFSPALARGFDYYNGIIFEIFDASPENKRSIFGGGRYDNLTELFDDEKIPAVGFGMGDVTLREFLSSKNLLPTYKSETDIYLVSVDQLQNQNTEEIGEKLRSMDLNVAIDTSDRKVGDKVKTALKHSVPFFIAVGTEEIQTNKYRVKNLKSEKESVLAIEDIVNFIRNL